TLNSLGFSIKHVYVSTLDKAEHLAMGLPACLKASRSFLSRKSQKLYWRFGGGGLLLLIGSAPTWVFSCPGGYEHSSIINFNLVFFILFFPERIVFCIVRVYMYTSSPWRRISTSYSP